MLIYPPVIDVVKLTRFKCNVSFHTPLLYPSFSNWSRSPLDQLLVRWVRLRLSHRCSVLGWALVQTLRRRLSLALVQALLLGRQLVLGWCLQLALGWARSKIRHWCWCCYRLGCRCSRP